MVDSAVGGKTGVNLGGKNLIGAFHQPSGVFASVDALATLPERELASGLGEALKTAVLEGEDALSRIERDAARLVARDEAALVPLIEACVRKKAAVVERDEREEGERALLNLGHTLGHALEALDGFGRLRHGEAVAIGLVFAAKLAAKLGRCPAALAARIEAAAVALGLPTRPEGTIAPGRVLEMMRKDKKARGGKLRFVLPRAPGDVVVADDVPEDAILDELSALGR
jgi:3-dehydroquinate synthase